MVDIRTYLEDALKILGDLFVCLSCEAKLNAAFDELSHYDLKDPNDFAQFLITANIGLVRAKLPRCIQFQKRTTRTITVLLSICVQYVSIFSKWSLDVIGLFSALEGHFSVSST